jgi:hypothetical protein
VQLRLPANQIRRTGLLYHGLGPIPVKVEAGFETSIGGRPIDTWSLEVTPDITTGVQHLEAQVNRDPYDGRFELVAQAKGGSLDLEFKWWASTISQ